MIPKFPEFKKLELSDKQEIESITSQFPPYSDFNFISMWSWDTHERMGLSELNGNLVVRFADYITNQEFYSFIGINNTKETVTLILEYAESKNMLPKLQLIPQEVVDVLGGEHFSYEQDRNNFDYLFSNKKLAEVKGKEYAELRKKVNRFLSRNDKVSVELLDLSNEEQKKNVRRLCECWAKNKGECYDGVNEIKAMERLLDDAACFQLINVGIKIDGVLVGVTINEVYHKDYVMSHFASFDIKYEGVYQYLMKETCSFMVNAGIAYLNCEQDLGIAGLRVSKLSMRPISFLKKYSVNKCK
jgi:hypothetical protein